MEETNEILKRVIVTDMYVNPAISLFLLSFLLFIDNFDQKSPQRKSTRTITTIM